MNWKLTKKNQKIIVLFSFLLVFTNLCFLQAVNADGNHANLEPNFVSFFQNPESIETEIKVDNLNVIGRDVFLEGRLFKRDKNKGIENVEISIFKLRFGENVRMDTVRTGVNGNFSFSFKVSESKLIPYQVQFHSMKSFVSSKSSLIWINNINRSFTYGIYFVFLLAVTIFPVYFLTRRISNKGFLKPLILGLLLGGFIVPLTSMIAFLVAMIIGVGAGYFFAKRTHEFNDHAVFGLILVLFYALISGTLFTLNLIGNPGKIGVTFSISQLEMLGFLLIRTADSVFRLVLSIWIGVVTGAYLKPRI